MDDLEFWECKRSHCRILKDNRIEFCARRREIAKDGDLCFNCKGGDDMGTAVEKKCVGCSKEFKPKSNVQKRCEECGAKHKAKMAADYRAAHAKTKAKPSQASRPSKPVRAKGNGAAYEESVDEQYLRSVGMTQIADQIAKFRQIAQLLREVLT